MQASDFFLVLYLLSHTVADPGGGVLWAQKNRMEQWKNGCSLVLKSGHVLGKIV